VRWRDLKAPRGMDRWALLSGGEISCDGLIRTHLPYDAPFLSLKNLWYLC
jgi:hypothetical protein